MLLISREVLNFHSPTQSQIIKRKTLYAKYFRVGHLFLHLSPRIQAAFSLSAECTINGKSLRKQQMQYLCQQELFLMLLLRTLCFRTQWSRRTAFAVSYRSEVQCLFPGVQSHKVLREETLLLLALSQADKPGQLSANCPLSLIIGVRQGRTDKIPTTNLEDSQFTLLPF